MPAETTMLISSAFPATSTYSQRINADLKFRQNSQAAESDDEKLLADEEETVKSPIQNFKAVNLIKTTQLANTNHFNRLITQKPEQQQQHHSSSSSFTLSRTSPQLNVALYIVICLLCFSLVINIILLYVSKMKQSREKLIITHEIRGKPDIENDFCHSQLLKPLVNTPSQRSGINSTKTSNSDDSGECNLNLINPNGSATSGIDGEH